MQEGGNQEKKQLCGAKTRSGKPCTNPPMEGRTRCRMHGGKTPAPGITHPNYKTGRRSKYLPAQIAARVGESLSDHDLLSARFEAALLEARCNELMERLATGESGFLWKRLKKCRDDFREANQAIRACGEEMQSLPSEDPESQGRADAIQARINALRKQATDSITLMGKLIDDGANSEQSWRELIDLSHEAVRMKQAESARIAQLRLTMTAEEAMVLVHNLQRIVVAVVKDKSERYEIGRQLAALLPANHGGAIGGPGGAAGSVSPTSVVEQPPGDVTGAAVPPPSAG